MKLFQSLKLLYRSQASFKYNLLLYLLLFILGSIALGLLEASVVRLVGPLLDTLNDQTSSSLREIHNISILKAAFVRLLIVTALALIWRSLILWSAISLGARLTSNIGNNLYRELTSQDYESFIKYDQSELISRFAIDLERVRACYTTFLNLLSLLILGMFLVVELFIADARTTLVCLLIFILFYCFISLFVGAKLTEFGRNVRAASSQQINLLSNLFSSFYLLKNGRLRETYIYSYTSNEKTIRKLYSRLQFFSSFPRLLVEGLGILALIVIIPLLSNEDSLRVLPILGVYGVGFYKLLPTLQAIYSNWNEYVANESFLASTNELVRELINRKETLKYQDSYGIMPTLMQSNYKCDQPLISLKNVYFRYADSEGFAISGTDHDSFYGDRILITGPSGSGKSTYVGLLTGLLQPTSGRINISQELLRNAQNAEGQGVQLRELLNSVCEHVPSKPFVFNQSLAYNIALKPDDEIDEERLFECIQTVQLGSEFRSLNRYTKNTNQILNNDNISNGERQKIGIARALYGSPKILVLDESLNSLDLKSSSNILADISAKSSALVIYLITHQSFVDNWATQYITIQDGIVNKRYSGSNHLK